MAARLRAIAPRTLLVFLAVLLLVFAMSYSRWYEDVLAPASLRLNAAASAVLLRWLGEDALSDGAVVRSARQGLTIGRDCDALRPFLLFAAAVIASPVAARLRVAGLLLGAAITLALNQLRIVSLFFTGIHFPAAFEPLHVDVWQPLFICVVVAAWLFWASWAIRWGRG
jgi:exosortase/archaeosortase family protein